MKVSENRRPSRQSSSAACRTARWFFRGFVAADHQDHRQISRQQPVRASCRRRWVLRRRLRRQHNGVDVRAGQAGTGQHGAPAAVLTGGALGDRHDGSGVSNGGQVAGETGNQPLVAGLCGGDRHQVVADDVERTARVPRQCLEPTGPIDLGGEFRQEVRAPPRHDDAGRRSRHCDRRAAPERAMGFLGGQCTQDASWLAVQPTMSGSVVLRPPPRRPPGSPAGCRWRSRSSPCDVRRR